LKNPLLDRTSLPRFDLIRPKHLVPAVRALLEELRRELAQIEEATTTSWAGLAEPIERIGDRLAFTWGIAGHLMGVRNCAALREAYEAVQPEVVTFSIRLAQSRAIFEGLNQLKASEAWGKLDAAQRRIVDLLQRDAELSGVGLRGQACERFNSIQTQLAELSTQFSNHVLDATKSFSLTLSDPEQIDGLPPSLLALAAQAHREASEADASHVTAETGPWRFTLDSPSWLPFMQHCTRRELREQMYRAYLTRASQGECDNSELIPRILRLRREEAELLGYKSFAEVSLASKMAPDVPAVERLLEDLRNSSFMAAEREMEELRDFARGAGAPEADDLQHWDIAFWSERMREERYAYREEDLRPYFPFPRVLAGLFSLAKRLFGVTIVAADGETPVWHEDVHFFHVLGATGEQIASFYLDPYIRPAEKRGGAWMGECVGRSRLDGSLRLPVAYLICNQTPPVDGKPALMTFREVETLFHEFGHSLQHMLTTVDYGLASGIRNVEWDAVELPSQFMENWCYHHDTLIGLTAHYETEEPLPEELFQKVSAARTFRAGSFMLRQLHFSMTDLELHQHFDANGSENAFDVERRIARKTTILPPLPEDRFLCGFEHIFSGGYAAGYYSYKWAEVLSADAFAAFEEGGLDDPEAVAATGRRYRDTVLALGGSRPPLEVFREFRGREPTSEALLRHLGLAGSARSD
jgi:oligopeptidase A